ncbi:MAG TPA: S41 family peptidase, partial [Caulobacteraceae bacterium]
KDGAMKLTTSMVYLPSGRMLQKTGIAPDVLVARDAAEAEFGIATYRWREASLKGAIDPTPPPAPIAPMQPELPPTGTPKSEDFQLTRALAELTAKRR